MEEAAEEFRRRKKYEKAMLPAKGTQIAALKTMAKKGKPEVVAAIAGITVEELRRVVG